MKQNKICHLTIILSSELQYMSHGSTQKEEQIIFILNKEINKNFSD